MTKKDTEAFSKPKTTKKKAVKKKAVKKKSVKKKAAGKTAGAAKKRTGKPVVSAENKRMMVAMHAYYKWEQAGRPDNSETHHWFEAEREIDEMLG